jgi:hypothetical protein
MIGELDKLNNEWEETRKILRQKMIKITRMSDYEIDYFTSLIQSHLCCPKCMHDCNEDNWPHMAAQIGHLECLKICLESKKLYATRTICEHAALNGHLNILRYAKEKRIPFGADACPNAARNGHLDCLIFLRENGAKWNSATTMSAIVGGHIECLKYSHEYGCPFDSRSCHWAKIEGQIECLRYLRAVVYRYQSSFDS